MTVVVTDQCYGCKMKSGDKESGNNSVNKLKQVLTYNGE